MAQPAVPSDANKATVRSNTTPVSSDATDEDVFFDGQYLFKGTVIGDISKWPTLDAKYPKSSSRLSKSGTIITSATAPTPSPTTDTSPGMRPAPPHRAKSPTPASTTASGPAVEEEGAPPCGSPDPDPK